MAKYLQKGNIWAKSTPKITFATLFERCLTLNFANSTLRTLHFNAAKRCQRSHIGTSSGHILRRPRQNFAHLCRETIIFIQIIQRGVVKLTALFERNTCIRVPQKRNTEPKRGKFTTTFCAENAQIKRNQAAMSVADKAERNMCCCREFCLQPRPKIAKRQ